MSVKNITEVLVDLITVHKTFRELGENKTDIIKKGDMSALDLLMKTELVHVHKLKKLEEDRLFVVGQFLQRKGLATEGVTMEQLLQHVSPEEKNVLEKLQRALLAEIKGLKEVNEMNQQLLQDSLRFVNLSLDLLAPQQDEEVNYKKPTRSGYAEEHGRSMFDSKA
ncbi:flagellar protein FlgN [Bacillus alkalicellulosilyticus]|uniref:flagellar protein FlgN n=1 Tax=Alkalihalobacterium alkalicellulosilyticum TaxID=1912214 RepID=UPI000997BA23|nr:flagellar protein FlgN [Bacillus alkalicellulosilyticus]